MSILSMPKKASFDMMDNCWLTNKSNLKLSFEPLSREDVENDAACVWLRRRSVPMAARMGHVGGDMEATARVMRDARAAAAWLRCGLMADGACSLRGLRRARRRRGGRVGPEWGRRCAV